MNTPVSSVKYFYVLLVAFAMISCKKDTTTTPATDSYALTINLSHYFGDNLFQSSKSGYITSSGDTLSFAKLEYYFTNIKLTKTDGTVIAPETYFLVDLDNPSTTTITINNIPKADYNKLSFLIGVDSLHNHSGAQTGALDPGYSMFWTWNVGYIFYRINGNFGSANTTFSFDIGGDANVMSYDLSTYFEMNGNRKINLKMDVKELFQNPNNYDLKIDDKDIHSITATGLTKLVQNSKDMFSISSIQ